MYSQKRFISTKFMRSVMEGMSPKKRNNENEGKGMAISPLKRHHDDNGEGTASSKRIKTAASQKCGTLPSPLISTTKPRQKSPNTGYQSRTNPPNSDISGRVPAIRPADVLPQGRRPRSDGHRLPRAKFAPTSMRIATSNTPRQAVPSNLIYRKRTNIHQFDASDFTPEQLERYTQMRCLYAHVYLLERAAVAVNEEEFRALVPHRYVALLAEVAPAAASIRAALMDDSLANTFRNSGNHLGIVPRTT